ncbi:MAG: hypothetical protein IJA23_04565, partial [Clostridia bacterium]|nr:hypothetical protein [Clostridia bacterium]
MFEYLFANFCENSIIILCIISKINYHINILCKEGYFMALVNTKHMLEKALAEGYAIPAFNI